MRTLIEGGLLVTPEGERRANLLLNDGLIEAIGTVPSLRADHVIDATGRYILPGCIDVHTHMDLALVGNFDAADDEAFSGQTTSDDFWSGSVAAACGGTTTIVDFAEQAAGQRMLEGVEAWHRKIADAQPVVDVGFHLIVRDLGDSPRADLKMLAERGVSSIKLFMAYKGDLMVDDAVLFEAMQAAAEVGALVMAHAESGEVIDRLIADALARGETEPRAHAETRPPATETEAVGRALAYAGLAGCALYVVHVSVAASADLIAHARAAGRVAWGETCTQYLICDRDDLARPDFEGAKFVFTPPARAAGDRERLWRALRNDELSVISSDHSPAAFADRKALGSADFTKIPNGAGGVEERLMMVHHHGVNAGRISLSRMVELLSTNPSKLLGLFPRKGAIAVGSDADLVIFDPAAERELSVANLHSRCDYTIYEGAQVRGCPESVLIRGEPVVEAGEFIGPRGHGEFIERQGPRRYWDTHVADGAAAG